MVVTQWFTENPLYVGVYERNMAKALLLDKLLIYSYWDGEEWSTSGESVEEANDLEGACKSVYQDLPWRGVTL